jgi:hypothetical protein
VAAVIGLSGLGMVASSASACGFIGCVLEQIAPGSGIGEALDDANRDLGHPAEQTLDGVLDYYVPGAGEAARAYQQSLEDGD